MPCSSPPNAPWPPCSPGRPGAENTNTEPANPTTDDGKTNDHELRLQYLTTPHPFRDDSAVHLARARATVPVCVQRHLATFPSPSASAVGGRLPTSDGRPLHRLERDHRGGHDRRLNVNWDRAFHQNLRTTRKR